MKYNCSFCYVFFFYVNFFFLFLFYYLIYFMMLCTHLQLMLADNVRINSYRKTIPYFSRVFDDIDWWWWCSWFDFDLLLHFYSSLLYNMNFNLLQNNRLLNDEWWNTIMMMMMMDDIFLKIYDDWFKQRPPSIQDDQEGHLIYKTGDVLQNRCSWQFFFCDTKNHIFFIIKEN